MFWSLDLIFILATYAEIVSFPPRTVFQNAVFSGSSMVGRGARLYRLIKIIQQYRIENEKRKRYNQELGTYYLTLSSHLLSYLTLSYLILSCLILLNFTLFILSCLILSYLILSYLIFSYLILPYLILSYLTLLFRLRIVSSCFL